MILRERIELNYITPKNSDNMERQAAIRYRLALYAPIIIKHRDSSNNTVTAFEESLL